MRRTIGVNGLSYQLQVPWTALPLPHQRGFLSAVKIETNWDRPLVSGSGVWTLVGGIVSRCLHLNHLRVKLTASSSPEQRT
jgi:hypothetical protein